MSGAENCRRLFEDDMRVGAAHAERTHPGAPNAFPLPGAVLAADDEGPSVKMQFGVGAGEMQCRRDCPVLKAQNRLDQARDPGRCLQVPDVGLDRTDEARAGSGRSGYTECLSQPFDFDRVAKWRARSMSLDIAHGRRIDVGDPMRLGDCPGLPGGVGRRVVHLCRSVVVDRRSSDHGVDLVTVFDGGLQVV